MFRSAAMVCALVLSVTAEASGQRIRVGNPAPEIDLQTLQGKRVRLSELRGHPVVLVFWGTWCGPCRGEFQELAKAHGAFSSSGLRILAVNGRDQEETIGDVERFLRSQDVRFDVILDKRGKYRRAYGLRALPTTIFVDSLGVMRGINLGAITPKDLLEGITLIR